MPPGSGYYNLYSNPLPRGPSLFGTGSGQGPLEGAIQSILPMLAESVRGHFGGFGFNFGSDMNIAASEFARQFVQQLNASRAAGAAADVPQINDLLRGMARMIGHTPIGTDSRGRVRFGDDVEQAMGRLAGFAGNNILPVLAAMFPDQVDRVFPRGSMAAAAGVWANYARFMTDPATGGTMLSDPYSGVRIFSGLLDDRAGRRSAGLGATRLAQAGEALFGMGLVGSGDDLRRSVEAIRDATGFDTGDIARNIQTSRIQDQIGKYAQVIAAINDIFAEAGRPDAPMHELIRGLQEMTQGSLGALDPRTLTRVVRTMHAATQTSGMSGEQLARLAGEVGGSLREFGGHHTLAPTIATYVAGFGKRYADMGYGAETLEGPGRDAVVALEARRMAATAGSEHMNLLGAVAYQSRLADADSPLARVGAALRTGRTAATMPDGRAFDIARATPAEIEQLFRDSGLSPDAFRAQLLARTQNQAALAANPESAIELGNTLVARETRQAYLDSSLGPLLRGRAEEYLFHLREVAQRPDSEVPDQLTLALLAARRMGLPDDQARELASRAVPTLDYLGQLTGLGSGKTALRAHGEFMFGAADEEMMANARRGARRAGLTHIMRGGIPRNLTRSIVEMGMADTEMSWVMFGLRTMGMVLDSEVENALLPPNFRDMLRQEDLLGVQYERGYPLGNMVGFAGRQDLVDPRRSGFRRGESNVGSATGGGFARPGRFGPMREPDLFSDRILEWTRDARMDEDARARSRVGDGMLSAVAGWAGMFGEIASRKVTEFQAMIGTLEVSASAVGVLTGRISATGTMTGDGTAVPPAPAPREVR